MHDKIVLLQLQHFIILLFQLDYTRIVAVWRAYKFNYFLVVSTVL